MQETVSPMTAARARGECGGAFPATLTTEKRS